MIRILHVFLFLAFAFLGVAQEKESYSNTATIGFYNMENLFDTIDDPNIRDEEFLPGGDKQWTRERYMKKLSNMAKIIASMDGGPNVLGVCEVENRRVMEHLIIILRRYGLNYNLVHFDSPDIRGIDVALLYDPSFLRPFYTEQLKVSDPADEEFITRDILYVKGLAGNDTLHFFVNHWPSRRGGKEDKRILAAKVLRNKVDELEKINPLAKIIIMGDFNDDPINKSIKSELRAEGKLEDLEPGELFNTSYKTHKKGYGTLAYRGAWNLFDQIIISNGLINSNNSEGVYYIDESFSIYVREEMLVQDGEYKGYPFRTFVGDRFDGGYSDHFPTYIKLTFNQIK
ncbi:endonuclease/exonuclease/phosphatase family protein [Marinigracilibium pacificum]|uniref:Endonuclease/exonuclease/phosphatase family protein n=1 Tax=Marinigracilibium pacificum TaxID=2729599 RepID=A0A848J7X4_9BACT|nr:endonuclease/exonuclease/phosphatase family protein [Marinigracilibium pacificum]NMM50590.1 endonuclease/exonuclease/phosphatase family protein [Marinigracilibium pacificum]